jgi:hypothetical protein
MQFDRFHDFITTWLLWSGISIVGSTFGVIFGEALGQWIAQVLTLSVGHLIALVIFEISIWVPRRVVFRTLRLDATWTTLTQRIWIVTEIFGWGVGLQLMRSAPSPQLTTGATFAAMIGASLWFILWCAQQARPGRWWVPVALCYALGGVIVSNSITVVIWLLSDEVNRMLSQILPAIVVHACIGALIGLGVGGLTGGVIARRVITITAAQVPFQTTAKRDG